MYLTIYLEYRVNLVYKVYYIYTLNLVINKLTTNGTIKVPTANVLTANVPEKANLKFCVKINNHLSSSHDIVNGQPQGSTLSVTLFLVAINDICKSKPVKYILFTDDCNIYCSGSQIETTSHFLQLSLNALTKWSTESGFSFSPYKAQCFIFNKRKKDPLPLITFMNTSLTFTNNIRILGLTFDGKLSWRPHLKKLKADYLSRINKK